MNNQERIDLIEEAIEMIIEAQYLVETAIEGTEQTNSFEAYGKYGFDRLLNNGNPYDLGLYDIMEDLGND